MIYDPILILNNNSSLLNCSRFMTDLIKQSEFGFPNLLSARLNELRSTVNQYFYKLYNIMYR